MVVLFLTPYLGLSSALQSVAPIIAAQLHMSLQAVNLTSGLANAGYAAGTVLAVQFSQLLPQRRMLLVYGIMLVAGSVLAADFAAEERVRRDRDRRRASWQTVAASPCRSTSLWRAGPARLADLTMSTSRGTGELCCVQV
jgi:hypothetical protein